MAQSNDQTQICAAARNSRLRQRASTNIETAGDGWALDTNVPMNYQIYLQLKAEIKDGLWVGRRDFPGEIELAERFGVSVITSRKALERLAAEGWIERGRGKRSVALIEPKSGIFAASAEVFPTGRMRPFTYSTIHRTIGVAPAEACIAFGVPVGSVLWLCSRLRKFEGRPHSVALNVQRTSIGNLHQLPDLRKLPMSQVLRRSGIRATSVTRQVGVSLPTPNVAAQLGITLNDPALIFTFTVADGNQEVVDWVRVFVHPDVSNPRETMDLKSGTWSTGT